MKQKQKAKRIRKYLLKMIPKYRRARGFMKNIIRKKLIKFKRALIKQRKVVKKQKEIV